ncbi:MAG TPA: hypothetical protein VMV46_20715 [Thermoanaerobaculia bacterium]|nr:hypothetical protein [Thermoanaerobaculia bacterium]
MADQKTERLDLEQALLDPHSVFATPAALLADERLDREQKVEILRRWQYDAAELEVAEEEGMTDGEPSLSGEISRALRTLTGGHDLEGPGPTKHGGS